MFKTLVIPARKPRNPFGARAQSGAGSHAASTGAKRQAQNHALRMELGSLDHPRHKHHVT